jgi:signal transduction histidine kinase
VGRLVRTVRPALRSRRPGELEASLWGAVAAFRILTLIPATITGIPMIVDAATAGWVIGGLVLMAGWTVAATLLTNHRGSRRTIATGDLAIGMLVTLMSVPAAGWEYPYNLAQPLSALWAGTAGLSWALSDGAIAGVIVVAVNLLPNVVIREGLTPGTLNATVLYVLAAVTVGYAVGLVREAEKTFAEGVRLQAATAERERLAREVHDGVLQILALVNRKGEQHGGDLAALGRLAGEQESALRKLVQSRPAVDQATGTADVKELIIDLVQPPVVSLAAPAEPVVLPSSVAEQVVAAVAAALDNVREHVGEEAPAWVLIEDMGDEVIVTVRDDGPGIAAGRLERAVEDGRLGVAQSIRGRVAELGGTVTIVSAPGQGTEVELRVPRI